MSEQPRPEWVYSYTNHHVIDGDRWRHHEVRKGDIIVATAYKSGTTWMQAIVANLLFPDGDFPQPLMVMCPWIDMRPPPLEPMLATLSAQQHRRSVKTHLPLDGLPYYEDAFYVVVGRDPRDAFMSLENHFRSFTPAALERFKAFDAQVGRPYPANDVSPREMWERWLTESWFDWETDGYPYWSHLRHFASWWRYRHLPNIIFVHFDDLLSEPERQVRRVAEFLGVPIDEATFPALLERISFAAMRRDFAKINPDASRIWRDGAHSFLHKGTSGQWRELLTEGDLVRYRRLVESHLDEEAARWLHGNAGY